MRMLVVGDQTERGRPLAGSLERNGHEVVTVETGVAALAGHGEADLVLLDLDLPDIDGLEVCRRIRLSSEKPVIAFAEGDDGLDRVLGLQAGADDCLAKPYEFRELLARIEAVTRRLRPLGTSHLRPSPAFVDGLWLDVATRAVRVHGSTVELTRKEFDLLFFLVSHADTVLTRQRIMAEVWGQKAIHTRSAQASRTIDTHVSSLRGKLGDGMWISTVRGVGFRLGSGGAAPAKSSEGTALAGELTSGRWVREHGAMAAGRDAHARRGRGLYANKELTIF
jgi:DNA-binding response OmpR family regulator